MKEQLLNTYPMIAARSWSAVNRRLGPEGTLARMLTAYRLDPLDAADALETNTWPSIDAEAIAEGGCKAWHAALEVVSIWMKLYPYTGSMTGIGRSAEVVDDYDRMIVPLLRQTAAWCPRLGLYVSGAWMLELNAFGSSFSALQAGIIVDWMRGLRGCEVDAIRAEDALLGITPMAADGSIEAGYRNEMLFDGIADEQRYATLYWASAFRQFRMGQPAASVADTIAEGVVALDNDFSDLSVQTYNRYRHLISRLVLTDRRCGP